MRLGSNHSLTTRWPARPFKIYYSIQTRHGPLRTGPVVSCASPEAVIRSAALRIISNRADAAVVWFDGSEFAGMYKRPDGAIKFAVY